MEYSKELKKATNKYYYYANKYDKCKSGMGTKFFLAEKREYYRLLSRELFIKEYSEFIAAGRSVSRDPHKVI